MQMRLLQRKSTSNSENSLINSSFLFNFHMLHGNYTPCTRSRERSKRVPLYIRMQLRVHALSQRGGQFHPLFVMFHQANLLCAFFSLSAGLCERSLARAAGAGDYIFGTSKGF
jgi:hypothetical protein